MKILLIGGTGLISTAISQQLIAEGHDLTLYNRGETEPRLPKVYRAIKGDRNNLKNFERQMSELGNFDAVIDMICFHPKQAESDIRAFKGRIGQLIFCSTVDVYTKPPATFPVVESHERKSCTDYGRDKAKCEDLFLSAQDEAGFPVTIIRPASTYGEGGTIIHSLGWETYFLDRIKKGLPIIVHGDGEALWVSCHVDDVGRAFVNAIGNKKTYGKAYHVTGDQWQTWNQYHQRLAEAIEAPEPNLVHIPADFLVRALPEEATITYLNFQYTNIFDNSAAKSDLGLEQTIDWKTGAKRTYDWLVEQDRIDDWRGFPLYDRVIEGYKKQAHELLVSLSNLNKRRN